MPERRGVLEEFTSDANDGLFTGPLLGNTVD